MPTRFFRHLGLSDSAAEVKPGYRFCRQRRDNVREMATVLALHEDQAGIPHVRFTLAFEQPNNGRFEEGLRVLALQSFVTAYRTRVA